MDKETCKKVSEAIADALKEAGVEIGSCCGEEGSGGPCVVVCVCCKDDCCE